MPPLQAVLGPALQNTFGHDTVHSVLGAVRSVGLVVTAGGSSLAQALLPPNTTGASIPWDEIGPATKELLQRLLRVLASITPEQAIGVGAVAVYVPLALLAGPFWPIVLPLRICGFTLGGVAKGTSTNIHVPSLRNEMQKMAIR